MHEAALMTGLMRQIETIAKDQDAGRVVGVSVWLGALSHMSPEHLEEHFRQASRGTRAEGAHLSATTSHDLEHEHAMDVILESVVVED